MIIDLRGTSGSGKSHVAHTLIEESTDVQLWHDEEEWPFPVATYLADKDLYILGTYKAVCGGCDNLGSKTGQYYLCELVTKLESKGDILLEGMLVSHTFRRWHDLSGKMQDYRFLFLDTPVEVCIERVLQRRAAKGNSRPYDPKHLINDHRQDQNVARKLEEAGRYVRHINHQNSVEEVKDELERWRAV